ncbi:MAG: hypothetical protein ABI091_16515 [Ferruginibacter sp.]
MPLRTKLILCSVFTILFAAICNGQTTKNIKLLKQKIQTADSVVILSHEVTAEYGTTPEFKTTDTPTDIKKWYRSHPQPLKFFDKGKLNRKIIVESLLLVDSNKNKLTEILLRQVLIRRLTRPTCDQPRHTIVIYKNDKQSYIDICFGCRRTHTSKDIDFSEFYLDEKKWDDLKEFFKANGLTKLFD